jgi:glutamate racemase
MGGGLAQVATRNLAAPIGVYDSGVGGLSVLRALQARLPAESFYYVADSVHCPYGDRESAEIQELALGVGRHLSDVGCKLIVVACNTISSTALTVMRDHLDGLPIVGMVPAVKPAIETTHTGVVGVLATQATVRGALYLDVLSRYAQNTRVISQACPGLVELIEAGQLEAPETDALLRRCVAPIVDAGADVVVLGCSHYPFIRPLLERILGHSVRIIEPSDAIALQTLRILDREGLLIDAAPCPGVTRFATSGNAMAFDASVFRLVGLWPDAESLVWYNGRLGVPSTASVI